jgi:histidyl-tRNA synthetase
MIKIKPALSKGTRDFLPVEVAKRQYIFETIKTVFGKYGFEPIETPAIERLETLTGKYGEEGDKLLFKILNSGDYLTDVRALKTEALDPKEVTPLIAEKGLRYDLTVPLARYVVQHQDKLTFPFKRYHIGPVWRADRPQKGRYQEFYQCDADVIGSSSVFSEVELLCMYRDAFAGLNFANYEIRINHRKVLSGLAELLQSGDLFSALVIAIDKLDKIGVEKVLEELKERGFKENQLATISSFLAVSGSNEEKLAQLETLLDTTSIGREGLNELKEILTICAAQDLSLMIDTTLARGLDYYTGLIVEVKPTGVAMGSIGGGGRYENLTEIFGGKNMTGVGVSFGIERIYDVMEELGLFPASLGQSVAVLVVPLAAEVEAFAFEQTQNLRRAGVAAEFFTGNVKKQKQFNFATDKNIPFIIEISKEDKALGKLRIKDLRSKAVSEVAVQELLAWFAK